MRTITTAAAVTLFSLCVASTASAQPAEEAGAPGDYVHDGFYMRLGLGLGYMTTSEDPGSATIKGLGSAYWLSFGGSPIPGLAIAGTAFMHLQTKPTVEFGGQSADATNSVFLFALGPMVDGYPNPKGGFHVGGGPLFSSLNAVNYTATGWGANIFTGYDFWIGRKWSLGPILAYTYSHTSKDPATDATSSISVLITIVDH